ncbi:hypothetical protein FJZ31_40675 [Candidatus Poribacteria bacterium]|nr:hypothetical protein [Candidatus Poribacteria bacterium]
MRRKSFFMSILLYFGLISLLFIFLSCGDEGETTKPTASTQNGGNEKPPPGPVISFAKEIKPIFDANCNSQFCHGANPISGLLLTSYDDFKKGGNNGPAFIPGNSTDSLIVKKISPGGGMPPGGELPKEQIDQIKNWIDEGGENN